MNNLQRYCLNTLPFIYADDTALHCTGSSPEDVECKLQSDLDTLSKWFVINKLRVNVTKTKVMLFTSNRSRYKHTKLNVKLCNENVEHVSNMKHLGLTLDSHLTFNLHINKPCGKLNSRSKLLWRISGFIDFTLARMLYVSLIHPHILYCNFVIDGASATEKRRLQIQQNSALCAVCDIDYSYPTAKLLSDVGVDSVSVCMMKKCCKIVYKGLNIMCPPPALNEMFVYYVPTRDLRSSSMLMAQTPRCKMQFGTKNLVVRGVGYWKVLPFHIKASCTVDTFKQNIKGYSGLVDRAYYMHIISTWSELTMYSTMMNLVVKIC